ncbi:MAG: polysaccharide deacetylase family protein [Gemmatimonadaceae bacterium]|nr:polysaccharide deacetylase family protein [Gemmatimonadaceae bacterium]
MSTDSGLLTTIAGRMSRRVTIVMYHFVRNARHGRYPRIAALDTAAFIEQLAYIRHHYQIIRMEDVLDALRDPERVLPPRALLLTFDDGYIDHFTTVFPLLDRLGVQASFFLPARAVLERRLLDVNKIHFVLAAGELTRTVAAMEAHVTALRTEHALDTTAAYRATFMQANRWDPPEVNYVKRVLQKGLPAAARAIIVDALFAEVVAVEETAFAEELYVSVEQVRCMRRAGMHIGGHGYGHAWLGTLGRQDQELEVARTMALLAEVGCDTGEWTMAYPYGSSDDSLESILTGHGCVIGLTTHVAVADLDRHRALALPRIDTNDLPTSADATAIDSP